MRPAMTRDELREKVARAICYSDMNDDVFDELFAYQKEQFICNADAAIDTIFAALKEPTEEMIDAFFEQQSGDEEPTKSWELMLSASPLAPEK